MARKTKAKKNKNKFMIEIYGIIIAAISVLVEISIIKKPLGEVGILLRDIVLGLFGIGGYIVPLLTFFVGVCLIVSRNDFKVRKRFIGICLLVYNILLMYHVDTALSMKKLDFLTGLSKSYDLGKVSHGGGVVCQIMDVSLVYLFGGMGCYIVLICMMLIFGILATEISIGELLNKLIEGIKSKPKKKERKVEKIIEELPEPIEKGIKSKQDNDKKIKILDFMKDEKHLIDKDIKADKETMLEKEAEIKQEIKIEEPEIKKESKKKTKEENNTVMVNEINGAITDNRPVNYKFPKTNILSESKTKVNPQDKKELLGNAKILEDTLKSFGVGASVIQVSRGPSVTRYELQPNQGVKVSRITNLADDLALNLAAPAVRIEAPIPGKAAVGIEVPNKDVVTVSLREVIESEEFTNFKSKVAFALGKDISGKCIITDIGKMPHLLIAGATGSGKSVCINTLITSLVYKSSPDDVKMLMIDPKVVELSVYNGIPHLLIPVVTDPKKASSALYWAVNEMSNRYKLFADNNVRNIESYNKLSMTTGNITKLPQIVIIIDELADLMMAAPNDVEDAICRLAQMARAAGMHLVIATQRPSVDVITGVIKANIPSRISFAVSSQIDSRTILDMSGAEKLLGKGDMLFMPIGENKPIRIQGAFISETEVENLVEFLKQSAVPKYDDTIIEEIESSIDKTVTQAEAADELLPEAIKVAVDYGQVSASMLQRRLRVGFNRAARLVEEMELRGIVGGQEGSKPRQVLISKEQYENEFCD